MEELQAWQIFESSGKVADYMQYLIARSEGAMNVKKEMNEDNGNYNARYRR